MPALLDRYKTAIAAAGSAALLAMMTALPQAAAGVEKLYILNCGEGVAGDISRWSPGVNVGKSMDFVDNCYLIKHAQGWLLWDTGVTDAIAAMPDGQAPGRSARDPLAAAEDAREPARAARRQAVGHQVRRGLAHATRTTSATSSCSRRRCCWCRRPNTTGRRRSASRASSPSIRSTKLEGDHDVFGDGSVTIISTPGHTPGHQSLLVKLPKTGAVVLSGDAVHFKDNWDNRACPPINFDKEQTLPRCSAWPTSWRRRRRSSGSITTRRSATG